MNIVGIAFGLAANTFTNVNSRLLLEVNQATVQSVVHKGQEEFRNRKDYTNTFSRSDATITCAPTCACACPSPSRRTSTRRWRSPSGWDPARSTTIRSSRLRSPMHGTCRQCRGRRQSPQTRRRYPMHGRRNPGAPTSGLPPRTGPPPKRDKALEIDLQGLRPQGVSALDGAEDLQGALRAAGGAEPCGRSGAQACGDMGEDRDAPHHRRRPCGQAGTGPADQQARLPDRQGQERLRAACGSRMGPTAMRPASSSS